MDRVAIGGAGYVGRDPRRAGKAYGDYAVETALRFRSSSSVEDIEGFNGAGLYTSYTGYLHPELLKDVKDHDATIERALLRVGFVLEL